jgi:hypothetical protein
VKIKVTATCRQWNDVTIIGPAAHRRCEFACATAHRAFCRRVALKAHLARAYGPGGVGEPQEVAEARLVMGQLEAKAIALAEQRGIGVPFF